jgi:6-phosphogluconolactonase (cycloisomerase 2 family)
VTANGKFAYLNVSDNPTPAEYRVNADGTLAVLNLGPTNVSSKSFFVSIDPRSRFVYATGTGPTGAQLNQFKINADGTLTALTPPAIQYGLTEGAIVTFEPSGQFAYVPNPLGNAVVAFHIGSDGTFSDLPSPTVAAGNLPISGASVQRSALKRGAGEAGSPMVFIRR